MKKSINLFGAVCVAASVMLAVSALANHQTGGIATSDCCQPTNNLAMFNCCAPTNGLASVSCCQPTNTFACN